MVTEPAASSQISRVCGPIMAFSAWASMGSYNRWVMPQRLSSWRASSRLGPYTLAGSSTSSPGLSSAMSTSATAARPLGTSTH